jgi:hypothetical protein
MGRTAPLKILCVRTAHRNKDTGDDGEDLAGEDLLTETEENESETSDDSGSEWGKPPRKS